VLVDHGRRTVGTIDHDVGVVFDYQLTAWIAISRPPHRVAGA